MWLISLCHLVRDLTCFHPQLSQIHVVKEARLYPSWNDNATLKDRSEVNFNTGIIAAKRALNELHQSLGQQGYTQVKNTGQSKIIKSLSVNP